MDRWGRWEQNDGAIIHSKRGKSPGVGPWWKRKTVLSSDFMVLRVHILCLSSQQHTQIWKKRLVSVTCYSHSLYSTNSSARFLYTASSFEHWHQHFAVHAAINCGRYSSFTLFLLFIAQSELMNAFATSVVSSEHWCWYSFVVDSLVIVQMFVVTEGAVARQPI